MEEGFEPDVSVTFQIAKASSNPSIFLKSIRRNQEENNISSITWKIPSFGALFILLFAPLGVIHPLPPTLLDGFGRFCAFRPR